MTNRRNLRKLEERDQENLNLLTDVVGEHMDIIDTLEKHPELKEKYISKLKRNQIEYKNIYGRGGIHPSYVSMNVLREAAEDLQNIRSELNEDISKEQYRKIKKSAKPKRKVMKKCKCK